MTADIVIVLGLRRQAFVLFRTSVYFSHRKVLRRFFMTETVVWQGYEVAE